MQYVRACTKHATSSTKTFKHMHNPFTRMIPDSFFILFKELEHIFILKNTYTHTHTIARGGGGSCSRGGGGSGAAAQEKERV